MERIKLAIAANNGKAMDYDWNKDHCECDPKVGMVPCQYCAIHRALKESLAFVNRYKFG